LNYIDEDIFREEIIKIKQSVRLKEINEKLKNAPSEKLQLEKQEILDKGYIENYPKTKFGEMVLQLVTRRATSYNFSGYTYKEEFYSNAIDKIMSYAIKNFDPDYINPRTGKKSKAFSYITEITSKAFVAIINEYRDEQIEINNLIPYDSLYQSIITTSENKSTIPEIDYNIELDAVLTYNNNLIYLNNKEYNSIFEVLREYEGKNVKLKYPKDYSISLDEFEQIKTLKFEYLDLTKEKDAKYIPSFPKRAKRCKENLTIEWE
jgi:hypothetical protein